MDAVAQHSDKTSVLNETPLASWPVMAAFGWMGASLFSSLSTASVLALLSGSLLLISPLLREDGLLTGPWATRR